MTNFIPIFPLALVVFPGEDLNLHIFEERYKQLISECHNNKKPFGIPAVIDNRLQEFGCLVEIAAISNVYESGEMDIKTRGIKIFRLLEIIETVPDKLYSGAIVNYPPNNEKGKPGVMEKLMESIRELHRLLNINKDFKKSDEDILSYEVAHHIGMSIQEEYEFLQLADERQREEYIKRYLAKVLPTVAGMEALKEKIKLNGHFKNPGGIDPLKRL